MRVRLYITLFLVASLFAFFGLHLPAKAAADSAVISEISMGSLDSASDEFVEIYNNSGADINLSGWGLYYKSATGKTWTKRATIQDKILGSHQYFLLASMLDTADNTMTSGMAQTGGVIQLRDGEGNTMDTVGWGTADTSEAKAATAALAGEVLFRSLDATTLLSADSENNLEDFGISGSPTPKAAPAIELPSPDVTQTYPTVSINEVFPNPASPQSDTTDEFIELFNPNNIAIDLSGWILKDGSGASYVIVGKSIPAMGYVLITSAESSLSLNNTGDIVYLFTPNNELIDQTADYGDAKEGLSWGVVGDSWSWTVAPTPSNFNSAAFVEAEATAKPAATKTTTKKTTAAKKAATKKAASKVSAAKAKKDATTGKPSDGIAGLPGPAGSSALWSWLLIVAGIGTIGYGIYEYRPELITIYHKFRAKRAASS